MSEPLNLLHLSDETLIHIFMFVDATDLYHLSFVCEKLCNLVQDEFLWIWCEARCRPNHSRKVDYCINNVTGKSKTVLLAGCTEILNSLSPDQIHKITSLEMLTVLAIENIHFDGSVVPLKRFPVHLKEISLSGSYVTHYGDFFRMCSTRLVNLKVMVLDRCRWFDSHTLVPLSKLPSLEILSFYLCKQLNDEDMSYISLAGKHGFKSLKILDLRFTGYGDEIIRSFTKNKLVAEIYFQSYSRTYWMDCAKWKLRQLRGELGIHPWNPDAMDEIDDTVPEVVLNKYGEDFNINSYNLQRVTDTGVRTFRYSENSASLDYSCPESVLYTRPYGKCKCGFVDKTEPLTENRIGNANFEQAALEQLIANLLKRRSTPNVNFLEPRPQCNWIGTRGPTSTEEVAILQQLSPLLITLLNNRYPSPMGDIIEVSLNRTLDVMLGRPPSEYRIQSLPRHAPRQENPANRNENHFCALSDKLRADLCRFYNHPHSSFQRQTPSTSGNGEPPNKKKKLDEPSTSKRKIDEVDPAVAKKRKMNDECSPSCSKDKRSDVENFGIFTDCADGNQESGKEAVEESSNDTNDFDSAVEVVEVVTTVIKDYEKNEDETKCKAECSNTFGEAGDAKVDGSKDEVVEAPGQDADGRNRVIEDWSEKKLEEVDEDMVVVVLQLQEEDKKELEKSFQNAEKPRHEGRTTAFFENYSKKLECLKGAEEIKVCVILGQINSPKNSSQEEETDGKVPGGCCSNGAREEEESGVLNGGNVNEEDCEESKTEDGSKLSGEDVLSNGGSCVGSTRTESTDNQNVECEDKSDSNVKEENFAAVENGASLDSCEENLKTIEENCDNSKNGHVVGKCVSESCEETCEKSEETCEEIFMKSEETCEKSEEICEKGEETFVQNEETSEKSEEIYKKSEETFDKSEETYMEIEEICEKSEEICKKIEVLCKKNEEKCEELCKKSGETSRKSEEIVEEKLKKIGRENVSAVEKNKEEDTQSPQEEIEKIGGKGEVEILEDKNEIEELGNREENSVQIEESKTPNEVFKENGIKSEVVGGKIEENKKQKETVIGEQSGDEKPVPESGKEDDDKLITDDDFKFLDDKKLYPEKKFEDNRLEENQAENNSSMDESGVKIINFSRNVGDGYLSLDEMSDERSIEVNIGEEEEEEVEEEYEANEEEEDVDEEYEIDEENKEASEEEEHEVDDEESKEDNKKISSNETRGNEGDPPENGAEDQSKLGKRPRTVSSSSSSSTSSNERAQPSPNIQHLFRAAEMQMILRHPRIEPTAIRYLSLRGYKKITDEALNHLAHLQLDLIDVTYTGVTVGGVKRFIEMNPNCRVVHESACKCGPRMHF